MPTLEHDGERSGWDPAIWSITALFGAAILYVACLS
jgi:hypothetical protein